MIGMTVSFPSGIDISLILRINEIESGLCLMALSMLSGLKI